jgi:hypothetical protein
MASAGLGRQCYAEADCFNLFRQSVQAPSWS